jgi:sugar phosphate isomerase/epimerase
MSKMIERFPIAVDAVADSGNNSGLSRRQILSAAPLAALTGMTLNAQVPAGRAQGRGRAVEGVVTPSPTAFPGGKPLLTLYSISLQWAGYDEACDTAAKAGWPAIGWTVRDGGSVLPENVVRDLPRAVAAARKAGLQVPIIITPLRDTQTQYVEQYLDTMNKLGLRYYQAPPLGIYDYTKDLQPQLDVWKPRIEALSKLNEKYGTTAIYHVEGGAGNIGGGGWDLWLMVKDFDPKYIGMDVDLGHATMKGGPEVWELLRFAHRNMLSVATKDVRWAKKTDTPEGPRRSDPSEDWPWTAEYVVPGTGMVNFKAAFEYMKTIGFAGSFLHYSEYFVDVPGKGPVSLLRPEVPKVVSKAQYIAALRRDKEFYANMMTAAGF